MKNHRRSLKIFTILIVALSIQVHSQELVPEWVKNIYLNESSNIDSLKESILSKDSSQIDIIKTGFI